jgi:hypothetical protein
MPAPEITHATREGDTVTYHHAPDCEAHQLNYSEKVPATHVMQTIGNGFHYLCDECKILFCDETKPLGTGVGQRIVVNARTKAEPARPEPINMERPVKATKAPAPKPVKTAKAPKAEVPRLASVPTEQYDKRAAAKKVAAAKKAQKEKAESDRIAEQMASDAAKREAAIERAARKASMAEPSLQQEVEKMIIAPNAETTEAIAPDASTE